MALTKVSTDGVKDGSLLNADINASAAISKSKIENLINNNADNRVITGSGTANTLEGESNLKFDGSRLGINDPNFANYNADCDDIIIQGSGNTGITINSGGTGNSFTGNIAFAEGNGTGGSADAFRGAISYKHNDDYMTFYTDYNERMRIDSSGRLMIGTTTEGGQFADDLTIANSGHTGITIRSGTDNVGSLYFSDGTSGDDEYRGAVQYNHTSNFLRFYSDATERMRIDSSGKVGINETNPARLLSVSSSSTDTYNISNATTVDAILLKNSGGNASGRNIGIQMNGGGSNGEVFLHLVGTSSTESAFYIGNRSGATRRVRLAIEPAGRLICGTSGITSNTAGGQVEVHGAIGFNDTGIAIKTTTTDTSSRSFMKFMNASNSVQGSIGMGGSTGVDYNTSSDYRLKENETVISDGITRVKQLIARKFNFKIEPDKTVDGFFAHEVSSIVPEAITGEKDAMKAETFYEEGDTIPSGKSVGDPKTYSSTEIQPQQIDQSKLVPLLTAALQEAVAKIEVLESKVAALEAA
jgi:hypothetical protein